MLIMFYYTKQMFFNTEYQFYYIDHHFSALVNPSLQNLGSALSAIASDPGKFLFL